MIALQLYAYKLVIFVYSNSDFFVALAHLVFKQLFKDSIRYLGVY
jgi:hypothetical protein